MKYIQYSFLWKILFVMEDVGVLISLDYAFICIPKSQKCELLSASRLVLPLHYEKLQHIYTKQHCGPKTINI